MGKLATFIKLATVLVLGGGTLGSVVAVSASQDTKPLEVEAANSETVRIYAVLKGDWDNRDSNDQNLMYMHTWTDGGAGSDWPGYKMTRILGKNSIDPILGYWSGLFYLDISASLLGENIILDNGLTYQQHEKKCNQTVSFKKTELINNEGKHLAVWVDAWSNDWINRNVSFGTLGCNAKQAAEIFSSKYFDVCNDIDLFPLMYDLFIEPSGGWETTTKPEEGTRYTTDVSCNEYDGHSTFKLDSVLNQFENQYFRNKVAENNLYNVTISDITIISITILSISTIGLFIFYTAIKKRKTIR